MVYFDVASRPGGAAERVPNDEAGIAQLVARLAAAAPTLIVLKAMGGLELPVTAALAAARLAVAVVTPRQARDFAKDVGQLVNTDALDARVLAHFAEVIRPAPRPLPITELQALAALLGHRLVLDQGTSWGMAR